MINKKSANAFFRDFFVLLAPALGWYTLLVSGLLYELEVRQRNKKYPKCRNCGSPDYSGMCIQDECRKEEAG